MGQYELAHDMAQHATEHRQEADSERQESFRRKRREYEQQLSALGVASVEQAQEWIRKLCVSNGIPQPSDVYSKGDWKGLIWAKCNSFPQRDLLITKIPSMITTHLEKKKSWAEIDLPIDKRNAESVLFAFKRMLVNWEFPKGSVRVDTDDCSLKISEKVVLKAKVSDYVLQLRWCDGDCESWEELQTSVELETIRKAAQEKLDRAKGFAGIGNIGKGKRGPQ